MQIEKGTISDNGEYLFSSDDEFTNDDLTNFINYHKSNQEQLFINKMNEYKGQTTAYNDAVQSKMANQSQLVINFPKNLVDTLNGYFVGIPPTIKVKQDNNDSTLQDWLADNSFVDKLSEVSKQASVYGKSFMLAYNNEDSELRTVVISPEKAFMIYDDTIEKKPIAFVRYGKNSKQEVTGTVYYADRYEMFKVTDKVHVIDSKPLVFGGQVPAVEFFDNEERMGVFDSVIMLIHAYDKALSAKLDDIEYFAHAYLFLKNFDLNEDEQLNIKNNRLIVTKDAAEGLDVDAKFLEKPDADTSQENTLNRLTTMIYQISMIANISDDVFGSSTSGTALAYKMQSMSNLAVNKERKFTQRLRSLFRILSVQLNFGDVKELMFKFTRNIPNNVAEEAATAKNMVGITSDETILSTLSVVDDAKAELERIKQEEKDRNQLNNPNEYDFQANQGD